VWVTWDHAAGAESGAGYKEAFAKGGAQVLASLTLPFPQTNFQPLLAQLPHPGVDVVGSFFAGGGAAWRPPPRTRPPAGAADDGAASRKAQFR
jgi:hypothetical protein